MPDCENPMGDSRPPELPMTEFRQELRRELLRALDARRARRNRQALGGLAALSTALAVVVTLFVLHPAWPARLHARLPARSLGASVAGPVGAVPDLGEAADASAVADRAWVEQRYADRGAPVEVRALEGERIFAIRQFELTSGKRVIVLSEIGATLPDDVSTVLPAARDF